MNHELNYSYNELFITVANNCEPFEINNRFQTFAEELIRYCRNEQKLFSTFRILNEMRTDIVIKNRMYNLTICDLFERICCFINTETRIAQFKLKDPSLIEFDKNEQSKVPALLHWTSDKIDLIELIYAIAHSINSGQASIEAIKNCFEYIFQINLGKIYDRVDDIKVREDTFRYIKTLPDELMKNIYKSKMR